MKMCSKGFRAAIAEQHTSDMRARDGRGGQKCSGFNSRATTQFLFSITHTHPHPGGTQHSMPPCIKVCVCGCGCVSLCADIPNEHLLVALPQREKGTRRETCKEENTMRVEEEERKRGAETKNMSTNENDLHTTLLKMTKHS